MLRIMSDNDVQGHVRRVIDICQSAVWEELWRDLQCKLCTFEDLGLSGDSTDATVWHTCQSNQVILITGNRNSEGSSSLEATIRRHNTVDALPVLTLADPDRIGRDAQYAALVVARLFDVLIDVDVLRGTGRLYLP
ncbi:MAG: hypothetical protein KJ000_25580 [Pirellulaceae bacterium]|nr:hypothetical protein [Pirellulaceae bacterium]